MLPQTARRRAFASRREYVCRKPSRAQVFAARDGKQQALPRMRFQTLKSIEQFADPGAIAFRFPERVAGLFAQPALLRSALANVRLIAPRGRSHKSSRH